MFNRTLKKETLESFKESNQHFIELTKEVEQLATNLYIERKQSIDLLKEIEGYINQIQRLPNSLKLKLKKADLNVEEFNYAVQVENDSNQYSKLTGLPSIATTAAGAGVAIFGVPTAMAIATTFGIASTGTAISTLSGAAATNAALAWLGGGALAAGGGGMVGGSALLALAGPVGWSIGAAGIGLGLITMGHNNKKDAEKAKNGTVQLVRAINKLNSGVILIKQLEYKTIKLTDKINTCFLKVKQLELKDYSKMNYNQKYEIDNLLGGVEHLSRLINLRIDGEKMCEINF